MFIRKGWRDRAAAAQARHDARVNPDEETKRKREERALFLHENDARQEEIRAREQEEREGPIRHATQILTDKLGNDLPEILAVITKAGGLGRLVPFLEKEAARIRQERQVDDHAARLEQRQADWSANRAADLEDMAARREKAKKAKARYQAHVESRNATAATEEAAG